MHRGVWRATVHGVGKSRSRLSDWATNSSPISIADDVWYLLFVFKAFQSPSKNFQIQKSFFFYLQAQWARRCSFSFTLPFTEMSPFVLEKDWSFLFPLINTHWESFEGQMICHCRVLTLVDGEDFWLRTLNSRFVLGEHGGAPNRKGTTFWQFLWGLVWERWVEGSGYWKCGMNMDTFSPMANLAETQ